MNSREQRVIMTRELSAISVTRKQLAEQLVKDILSNFTNSELGIIANTIKQGNGLRLLELIRK